MKYILPIFLIGFSIAGIVSSLVAFSASSDGIKQASLSEIERDVDSIPTSGGLQVSGGYFIGDDAQFLANASIREIGSAYPASDPDAYVFLPRVTDRSMKPSDAVIWVRVFPHEQPLDELQSLVRNHGKIEGVVYPVKSSFLAGKPGVRSNAIIIDQGQSATSEAAVGLVFSVAFLLLGLVVAGLMVRADRKPKKRLHNREDGVAN